MIHYVVPWKTGDIGGGINAAIELLPADAWVCLRDGDTLFLTPQWGRHVEEIVAQAALAGYSLVGCMTNRLRARYQLHHGVLSHDPDISHHLAIAEARAQQYGAEIQPTVLGPIAGMFMLFPRRLWAAHPFAERSIYFDQLFTTAVRSGGGRVGVALGLYLFHLYRWGQPDPTNYQGHLK